MDNLKLWNAVEETDPDFTKVIPGGAGLTSINTSYLVKKMTEQFGPIGDKWGYDIKDEKFIVGAPYLDDNGQLIANTTTHTLLLELWYENADGKRCAVQHYGHTDAIYKNKYGLQTEKEPNKKSLTDALGKCLSMLGFGGDIFMGMYDDREYVKDLENKVAIEKSDDKAAEVLRQEQEYKEWIETTENLIKTTASLHELEAIYTAAIRRSKRKNDKSAVTLFTKATTEAKKRIAK